MRSCTAALLLFACLSFTVQASFFEHIFNHTKLRGNFDVNTTNGLKVGYNGKLSYQDQFLGLDIADVDVGLNAVPEKRPSEDGLKDTRYLNYTGKLAIKANGETADLNVQGLLGATSGLNSTKVGLNEPDADYIYTLFHENRWDGQAHNYNAAGTHAAKVLVKGNLLSKGDHLYIREKAKGYANLSANVFDPNGTHYVSFLWQKDGEANSIKEIVYGHQDDEEIVASDIKLKPVAAFRGKSQFHTTDHLFIDDNHTEAHKYGVTASQGTLYHQAQNGTNSSFEAFGVKQDTVYAYNSEIVHNGESVGVGKTFGKVGEVRSVATKVSADGTHSHGVQSYGGIAQISKWMPAHDENNHTITTEYNAKWAHNSRADADANNHVKVASATLYAAQGKVDNKTFHDNSTWGVAGDIDVENHNATFDINPTTDLELLN